MSKEYRTIPAAEVLARFSSERLKKINARALQLIAERSGLTEAQSPDTSQPDSPCRAGTEAPAPLAQHQFRPDAAGVLTISVASSFALLRGPRHRCSRHEPASHTLPNGPSHDRRDIDAAGAVPGGRGGGGAAGQVPAHRQRAGLSAGGRADRAVRGGVRLFGVRGELDPALRRVRRGAAAVPDRPGAASQAPVGHARGHLRPGRGAGRRHRRSCSRPSPSGSAWRGPPRCSPALRCRCRRPPLRCRSWRRRASWRCATAGSRSRSCCSRTWWRSR